MGAGSGPKEAFMCQDEPPSVRLGSMAVWLLAALLLTACFREAPPCDQPGFDAVAETCVRDHVSMPDCAKRLDEHEAFCKRKVEAE